MDSWEGQFFFDPEDLIYQFHFPGNPVVPGSVMIQAFMKALLEKGVSNPVQAVHRFRFKTFVKPGLYPFQIEKKGTAFTCRLYKGGKTLVTGTLEI